MTSFSIALEDARELVQSRCRIQPMVGIVLGSGLGALADQIEYSVSIPYADLAGFPQTSAAGHSGHLVLGYLSGMPVAALRGRAHLYEGHSIDASTFPVRFLHHLGVETLIVSNASGGMNDRFESGDLVLIDSHINWMNRPCRGSANPRDPQGEFDHLARHGDVYDTSLGKLARKLSTELGFELPRGTYLATLGPNYETRAEYRFFRRMGADMVGMSTVPEVLLAAQLGLRVIAFSVVTNVANPDSLDRTSHQDVLHWADSAQTKLTPLVKRLLDCMSGHPD